VVLGLEGRVPEAESLVKADLPPDDAAARVAELKQLLSKKEASSEKSADHARGRAVN
jgi:Flp pilus assembly protein TadD